MDLLLGFSWCLSKTPGAVELEFSMITVTATRVQEQIGLLAGQKELFEVYHHCHQCDVYRRHVN